MPDRPQSCSQVSIGRIPGSTYRIQFNHGFTFRDGAELVPYLAELGVSDLYASPYLQARPGSMHGYDISNHNALNPEIGTEEEHARMTALLREHGMGHLLDIVPNHMGIAGGANPWWLNVLENGPSSPFARYFDIQWNPLKPEMEGKVLLPVLGDQFGQVLESGDLKLVYESGRFRVEYFENRFPVAPGSSSVVLRQALEELELDEEHPDRMELESIVTALEHLPPRKSTDAASIAERRRERIVSRRRLQALYDDPESGAVRRAIDVAVERFNGEPGDSSSFDRLDALLADQAYRLAHWRVAAEEINYRRFFDVNDLAGVRVELPEVFQVTHRLILHLVREGKVTGLRIDHPDGLFHPRDYLRDLQRGAAGLEAEAPFYLLVEKILTGEETLPPDWPVAGTVGYEFLNRTNGVFVARDNEARMDDVYREFTGETERFPDLVYRRKGLILREALVSELTVLTNMLSRMSEQSRCSRDFTWGSLRDALRETVACFPVYRTYVDAYTGEVAERDRGYVEQAIRRARRRNPSVSASLFDYVRDILLLRWPESLSDESREEHARFVMKFQQLTGPVMAKGVEDTAFYLFNRLVSLNEVGGEPERFGVTPEEFHRFNQQRAEHWPHAMCALSTHDTKRSEDVRARINVLSEIPDLWAEHVARWAELNRAAKDEDEDGHPVPDANDEYLLYQTLVGAWPLEEMEDQAHQDFVGRVQAYMEKATREAKRNTSWINPSEEYDTGLRGFVAAILDRSAPPAPAERAGNPFVDDLLRLQPGVARMGMLNSLSQTLLKLVSPGVPDTYQGQEIWDFSLVDPDNRRPVDFALRRRMLRELRERLENGDPRELARELVERWEDGRIKLYLTHRVLTLRAALPELFRDGAYVPLSPAGVREEHVLAFARRSEDAAVVAAVPRLVATLTRESGFAFPTRESWADTWIEGGNGVLKGRWRNVLTGAEVEARRPGAALAVDELFADFPVALLERVE
ncbi:MAG TPA: malto-oligosyltrehalose synthase [Longimicrobiaceae bacterium]|nr:malto-oligosyltrehalose synthase [Longimicrobiaceae bacterium]